MLLGDSRATKKPHKQRSIRLHVNLHIAIDVRSSRIDCDVTHVLRTDIDDIGHRYCRSCTPSS